jgi:hypothetical protein
MLLTSLYPHGNQFDIMRRVSLVVSSPFNAVRRVCLFTLSFFRCGVDTRCYESGCSCTCNHKRECGNHECEWQLRMQVQMHLLTPTAGQRFLVASKIPIQTWGFLFVESKDTTQMPRSGSPLRCIKKAHTNATERGTSPSRQKRNFSHHFEREGPLKNIVYICSCSRTLLCCKMSAHQLCLYTQCSPQIVCTCHCTLNTYSFS